MRRRGPKTPFQPPYRRRDVDTAAAPEPNHPIRRSGAIDQRLIEGSRISSPYFNQFRREDGGRSHQRLSGSLQQSQSYGRGYEDDGDNDMQLDAFGELFYSICSLLSCLCWWGCAVVEDLELLAQTDNMADAGTGPGRGLLRQARPPKQVSKFFQGVYTWYNVLSCSFTDVWGS